MQYEEDVPILLSFSGGRTSAFMVLFVLTHDTFKNHRKIVVFANTGRERNETLEFVNNCDKHFNFDTVWVEAEIPEKYGDGGTFRVVTFETATRITDTEEDFKKGTFKTPFNQLFRKKKKLPNHMIRDCTLYLKLIPIKKYLQSLGVKRYYTALGIRADEPTRVRRNNDKIFPLVDDVQATLPFIRRFWETQDFDLELKDYQGNCDLCFLKSNRKLKRQYLKTQKGLTGGMTTSKSMHPKLTQGLNFSREAKPLQS